MPIVTTPSGLQIEDIIAGSGPMAVSGQHVIVHYTGWLADGTKFDSSVDRKPGGRGGPQVDVEDVHDPADLDDPRGPDLVLADPCRSTGHGLGRFPPCPGVGGVPDRGQEVAGGGGEQPVRTGSSEDSGVRPVGGDRSRRRWAGPFRSILLAACVGRAAGGEREQEHHPQNPSEPHRIPRSSAGAALLRADAPQNLPSSGCTTRSSRSGVHAGRGRYSLLRGGSVSP